MKGRMGDKHYSTRDICTLREYHSRRMKEEGAYRMSGRAASRAAKRMAA